MDVDAMNTVLFTNLQLLGMDIIAMEGKYHITFSKDMFNLPNKAGSEAVLHFLFDRLNPTLFKEQFRDCWPVLDRKAEMQFRKVCNTWLSSIQVDNPEAHLPKINASLLLSPGGRKFVHLLYKFSSYVLTQTMVKEHKFNLQELLAYPVTDRSSFGDIMKTALEDSCWQLHSSCFEQLHLTVAANRKWRENADELVKTYRCFCRSKRDFENEKRQLVSTLAESAQKQSLSLPSKRTVSMFDSGQDIYSRHRGKRMEQGRSKWTEVHKFSEAMRDKRKIIKSVLDTMSEKPTIDGNELGVRIPNVLLQEFQKEIQKQEIDNVYKGGCLNLESVSLLWNMCLRRYKEEIEGGVLPDLSDEIPKVRAQMEQHHGNLKIAQKTREEVLNVTIPKIQDEVDKLNRKLQSLGSSSVHHDKSNNSPGLGLIAPTPPLTTSSRNVKMSDTPTVAALTSSLKHDTPDAVSSVVGRVNHSIRLNSEHVKDGLRSFPSTSQFKALKKSSQASFSKSTVPENASLGIKAESKSKELKHLQTKGKPLKQVKKEISKTVRPTANHNFSATAMESSDDVLVDSIVDSVLNVQNNHRDSWSLELKSISDLMQYGNPKNQVSDPSEFVSMDLLGHNPLESSLFSPHKDIGNKNQSQADLTKGEDQDQRFLDNTSLWRQTSPTYSVDKKIVSEQSTCLFSPITSSSADSQLDSVASASNKIGHAQSSLVFSPVSSHQSPTRGKDNASQFVFEASNILIDGNDPHYLDHSESKHLAIEVNLDAKDSFFKSLVRFPGDGEPSQESESSDSSDESEMASMSKDSLCEATSGGKKVSPTLDLLNDSHKFGGVINGVHPLAEFTEVEERAESLSGISNFQVANAENELVSRPFPANLQNLSSEDLLDLDGADDILQSLNESFSPAKGGIVFESGRLTCKSPAKQTQHSLVSGSFSCDSERTCLSSPTCPENPLEMNNISNSSKKSSDCKQTSSNESVPKSQKEDSITEMVILEEQFANMNFV